MIVFPDTNFLVSAFSSRAGLSSDVLSLVLANHELVTGEPVLDEFRRVMNEKLKVPSSLVAETERFLRQFPVFPVPELKTSYSTRDPDDDLILQCAIQSRADVMITGDKDLLAIRDQVKEIRLLNPREFWELLQKPDK